MSVWLELPQLVHEGAAPCPDAAALGLTSPGGWGRGQRPGAALGVSTGYWVGADGGGGGTWEQHLPPPQLYLTLSVTGGAAG